MRRAAARTLRHLAAARWPWVAVVLCTSAGFGLSLWSSFSQTCALVCSGWQFDPWWAFWASLGGAGVVVAALLAGRRRWPRGSLVAAALAAAVAVSPLPIDLTLNSPGTPILKG